MEKKVERLKAGKSVRNKLWLPGAAATEGVR